MQKTAVGRVRKVDMENWLLALVLKPFFALVLFGGIVLPIKLLFQRYMKDGPVKRLLFRRIGGH